MHIFLLRHGKAAPNAPAGGGTSMRDEDRPLTAVGKRELASACQTYAKVAPPPSLVLASPLLRAQQSAEILTEAVDFSGELETCSLITPASRPHQVLDRLHGEATAGTTCVALVGHEPHLGSLLALLVTGDERYAMPLRKGMLVWVELDSPQTMIGRLRLALTPRDAAGLGL